jgi:uncharacterized membrane protein YqjE
VTPWEVERLEQQERLARSKRQTRRLMRTMAVVSLSFTALLVVAMLVLILKEQPTWLAVMSTLAVWLLGVSFGWTLKWSFDSWIDSA